MPRKAKAKAAAKVPKRVFSVRLNPELIEYLRDLAARQRRPMATQLEIILEDYQAHHPATESRRTSRR